MYQPTLQCSMLNVSTNITMFHVECTNQPYNVPCWVINQHYNVPCWMYQPTLQCSMLNVWNNQVLLKVRRLIPGVVLQVWPVCHPTQVKSPVTSRPEITRQARWGEPTCQERGTNLPASWSVHPTSHCHKHWTTSPSYTVKLEFFAWYKFHAMIISWDLHCLIFVHLAFEILQIVLKRW